ncbi:MAG: LPS export ABC transporter permease LptG [Deltaproteobacteria bacterium]|nr:LPS export ABC transporter permease LptG [Deltaproteobacteria bacterium]MBW2208814.1 LPS export ABC transporter permease LptG [Deltaproteobacteria bacterium]
MRILSRYLTREFLKNLLLCQSIFLFLYLFIDFVQKVDNFLEANASAGPMVAYFLYKMPYVFVQMMPPASLIALLITFSIMKKNNEIIAMRSCGMSVFSIARPIIAACFILGIAVFLVSEIIVPYSSSESNRIWKNDAQQWRPDQLNKSYAIWYRGAKAIYWIRSFDHQKKTMDTAIFYFFDNNFRLAKRIDARKVVWVNGRWRAEEGVIQRAESGGKYAVERFDHLVLNIPELPETFMKEEKSPEEMSYWQLERYANKVRLEGYDNTRYLVDMFVKTAFPWAILMMAVLGIPISLAKLSRRLPLALTAGIGIVFIYMVVFGLSRSLGLSGVLPPLLSAWLANLIFFFIGIYWMIHVEK